QRDDPISCPIARRIIRRYECLVDHQILMVIELTYPIIDRPFFPALISETIDIFHIHVPTLPDAGKQIKIVSHDDRCVSISHHPAPSTNGNTASTKSITYPMLITVCRYL